MKLISTILLASTAAALKQRAAPTKALQVRGGGMVEKSTALTVTKVVFGLYGAQMLLVPDFVMTQNVQAGWKSTSHVASRRRRGGAEISFPHSSR